MESNNKKKISDSAAESQPSVVTQTVAVQQQSISGPLPSPEVLARYESIVPGAGERILRMAEKSQDDIHEGNIAALNAIAADTKRGQWSALIVTLSAFATAAFLGYLGHPAAASIIGGATVVGLVGVFIKGRPPSA